MSTWRWGIDGENARSVACPLCGAAVGEMCVTSSGRTSSSFHGDRFAANETDSDPLCRYSPHAPPPKGDHTGRGHEPCPEPNPPPPHQPPLCCEPTPLPANAEDIKQSPAYAATGGGPVPSAPQTRLQNGRFSPHRRTGAGARPSPSAVVVVRCA